MAAVTAGISCGWAMFSECSELLHGRRFSLSMKWSVYEGYMRPAIL